MPPAGEGSGARRLRLLVVEDVPDDAILAVRELESAGFSVEWARVYSAGELLDALQHVWDAVVTDYRLPDMDGLEAIGMVTARRPGVPVIVLTGTAPPGGAEKACIRAGAAAFLTKDEMAKLPGVLARHLHGSAKAET